MNQRQLECEVATATGLSVCEVRQRGFSLADPTVVMHDPEPSDVPPQFIDWDNDVETPRPYRPRRRSLQPA